jgi:hypothetical protein
MSGIPHCPRKWRTKKGMRRWRRSKAYRRASLTTRFFAEERVRLRRIIIAAKGLTIPINSLSNAIRNYGEAMSKSVSIFSRSLKEMERTRPEIGYFNCRSVLIPEGFSFGRNFGASIEKPSIKIPPAVAKKISEGIEILKAGGRWPHFQCKTGGLIGKPNIPVSESPPEWIPPSSNQKDDEKSSP